MPRTTELASSTPASPSRSSGGAISEADRDAELVELGKAFRLVFRALRRLRGRDTHLIGSEVSHAQMELMIELSEAGPLSAGELATAAQLTPGTVTQMLDHLAECGHVGQRPPRRRHLPHPTGRREGTKQALGLAGTLAAGARRRRA
jgi:hypothetical protein